MKSFPEADGLEASTRGRRKRIGRAFGIAYAHTMFDHILRAVARGGDRVGCALVPNRLRMRFVDALKGGVGRWSGT